MASRDKRRRPPEITAEVLAAYRRGLRTGDHVALNELLGWDAWTHHSPLPASVSPFGVDPDGKPGTGGETINETWDAAVEMQRRIQAALRERR